MVGCNVACRRDVVRLARQDRTSKALVAHDLAVAERFLDLRPRPGCKVHQVHRKSGQQGTLGLMLSVDGPVGIIEPTEVGIFAAHLLSQEDTAKHNKAKYVLNGPEDVTGAQAAKMVESYIGEQVKDAKLKDVSAIEM